MFERPRSLISNLLGALQHSSIGASSEHVNSIILGLRPWGNLVDVHACCPFSAGNVVVSFRSLMTSGVAYAVSAKVFVSKIRALYGNGGVSIVRSCFSRTIQEGIFMRMYVPSMLTTPAYSKIFIGSRTLYLWTSKKSSALT